MDEDAEIAAVRAAHEKETATRQEILKRLEEDPSLLNDPGVKAEVKANSDRLLELMGREEELEARRRSGG